MLAQAKENRIMSRPQKMIMNTAAGFLLLSLAGCATTVTTEQLAKIQTLAEQASSKADNAQSTADQALSRANAAQTTASQALSRANAAQSTADQALQTANEAKEAAKIERKKAERIMNKAMQK